MKKLMFILVFALSSLAHGQNLSAIDSLKSKIQSAKQDTSRINLLLELGVQLISYNPDTVEIIESTVLNISNAQLSNGLVKDDDELLFYQTAKALALNNLGYISNMKGRIEQALGYFHQSMTIKETLNDSVEYAQAFNNLGVMYLNQLDYIEALTYLNKCVSIRKKTASPAKIGETFWSIAMVHVDLKDSLYNFYLDSAIQYYGKSGNDFGQASKYFTKGIQGKYNDQPDTVIHYYKLALPYYQKLGKLNSICKCYEWIAYGYMEKKEANSSLLYCDSAYVLATERGYPARIQKIAQQYNTAYQQIGNYEKALEMYELHITMRDSINNEKTQKATIRQQTKYEFEKAQLVAEQQRNDELRILNDELKRRDNLQYSIIFLGILLVFGLVLSLGFIKLSPTIAEGVIFFAFLILFEFLLVLGDPYVDSITDGEPIYKLLLNALLAGLIFPLHAFFEKTLKKRLVA